MSGPSTSTIVHWYAPPCEACGARYVEAYTALDWILHLHGYAPHRGTGAYNCRCSTGTGPGTGKACVNSTHSLGPGDRFTFWSGIVVTTAGAVDVNPDKNPYGPRLVTDMPIEMIRAIEAIRTTSGAAVFRWGGRYTGNKDAMHYEPICEPHDLASGIDWSTVEGWSDAHSPKPKQEDDEMFDLVVCVTGRRNEMPTEGMGGAWWFINAYGRAWCPTPGNANQAYARGQIRPGGCNVGKERDAQGNLIVSPLEVSPTYILEHRPLHPLDDRLDGGEGDGGNAGHFPRTPAG